VCESNQHTNVNSTTCRVADDTTSNQKHKYEVSFPRVDQAGCAKVRTNFYSVPLKPGSVVEARVYSSVVEFRQDGVPIAQHQRSYERAQQILDLEHYLEALESKPGALRGSKPLAQWRVQGRWPASYHWLWELMNQRHGRTAVARSIAHSVQMLLDSKRFPDWASCVAPRKEPSLCW
jgi:hypothetical protein